ncbi:unnamed protein product [Bursaphelenchus okinawaensis]|uniref:Uncharacterized protein n=1 Tax=Bursaphelenchus okinawaensis TaxID=465554 RepID=A0A811LMA7_9BILA|nr:unnamed protein product [Bursaphelenchus okinawaensis]CAG9127061.1 unnamed protein product [Bursaphelenchus okinawaensis]
MATGSLIVRSQSTEECPSTSEDMDSKPLPSESSSATDSQSGSDSAMMAPRRHSFREVRQVASSSDEDEDDDEDGSLKKRKFSMDQHRSRSMKKENRSRHEIPNFISRLEDAAAAFSPLARIATTSSMNAEFLAPSPVNKKTQQSRPNSPSHSGTLQRPLAVASRHRLASIRRESDCGQENEVAHEKMVKTTQQVSTGFEDFCIDEKVAEERKRAKSLAEPISVFTNAFLPQSSSPSPTRATVEAQKIKQCYSPSTNQVVRSNISYSPSPSPTPSSPSRSRIMRSMSPIAVRQVSKRRYTATGGSLSGRESDNDSQFGSSKRSCIVRSAASPLVRDSLSAVDTQSDYRSSSPLSVCSNSSFSQVNRAKLADNPSNHQNSIDSDDNATIDDALTDQFYLNAPNDACSTTSISRTETPIDEQMMTEEAEPAAVVFGPRNQPISIRDSPLPPPSPLASKSITFT